MSVLLCTFSSPPNFNFTHLCHVDNGIEIQLYMNRWFLRCNGFCGHREAAVASILACLIATCLPLRQIAKMSIMDSIETVE
ncbi:MAG: hypothetical protein Q8876_09455 [Bacillota bacterium]|nr:hypothetical protein [Bacillota bacterium]